MNFLLARVANAKWAVVDARTLCCVGKGAGHGCSPHLDKWESAGQPREGQWEGRTWDRSEQGGSNGDHSEQGDSD